MKLRWSKSSRLLQRVAFLVYFECKFDVNIFLHALKQNFMKIEFENSIRRLSFLCRLPDIKIAWINPCVFRTLPSIYDGVWNFLQILPRFSIIASVRLFFFSTTLCLPFSFNLLHANVTFLYPLLKTSENRAFQNVILK